MTEKKTQRRRFLQGAGASGTALLAGCLGSGGDGNSDNQTATMDNGNGMENGQSTQTKTDSGQSGNGGNGGNGGDSTNQDMNSGQNEGREVGIIGAFDQQRLRKLQIQLQQGEITSEEANKKRRKIIDEGLNKLKETIEATETLTIKKRYRGLGGMRVMGDARELIDVLNSDTANAMVPADRMTQQGQTGGTGSGSDGNGGSDGSGDGSGGS